MSYQKQVTIRLESGPAGLLIGLIADTHNLVRDEALEALRGSDVIMHAGDICSPSVLQELMALAPVHAVRGNNDRGPWAEQLSETALIHVGEHRLYMIHDLKELVLDPAAVGIDVVISGHSHRPLLEDRDGILYINPGSAGPRRFRLPVAVGRLHIIGSRLKPELVELAV